MTVWFLIVMIIGGSTTYSGHAVTQVGPFNSKDACWTAGKALPPERELPAHIKFRCVSSDGSR